MLTPQTIPTPRPAFRAHSGQKMMLRHAREGSIVLRGPSTGQVYRFSDREATAVLTADADALLRTGTLVRADR